MKRLLIFVLVIISIESFGQNPGNYTYINGKYRWQAGIFDSTFRLPRYNGVPSGLRNGEWSTMDGALAADTLNGHFYGYWNTTWKRLAYYTDIAGGAVNIYNTSAMLTANRTLTGNANSFSLNLDSLLSFRVGRNNIPRITMNSTLTEIASPNQTAGISVNNSNSLVSYSANAFRVMADSTTSIRKISYDFPFYTDLLTYYSLTPKYYVDSLVGAGGGGGTPGGSDKQVQYNNAGSFGGSAGFETALTNLRTKITAQAATEVPLEIKHASTPSADYLNISSNSGTGDILKVTAGGESRYNGATDHGNYDLQLTRGMYVENVGSNNSMLEGYASSGAANYFNIQNTSGTAWDINAGSSMVLGLGTAASRIKFSPAFSEKANVSSTGFYIGGSTAASARLHVAAGTSTAGTAPIKLVSGTALSAIEDGALEYHTSHLYFSIGSTRYQLDQQKPSLNKAVTIEAPSSSEAIDMWQTPVAITVTSLKAILRGSSPSVTYNIRFGTDITSSTDVFTANITCTSTTTGCSNSSGFNDATIPAGSFIWVITSAMSGTVNSISLTLNYTED